jgi:hypothetical protein
MIDPKIFIQLTSTNSGESLLTLIRQEQQDYKQLMKDWRTPYKTQRILNSHDEEYTYRKQETLEAVIPPSDHLKQ